MLDTRFSNIERSNEGANNPLAAKAIVFDSANPEFFIAHVDMTIGEQMDALAELGLSAPERVNVFQAVGELLRHQPQLSIVKLAGIARGGAAEFVIAADVTSRRWDLPDLVKWKLWT